METLIIGNDCTVTSKDLPYGEYKITEKEKPKGYYLNEIPLIFLLMKIKFIM